MAEIQTYIILFAGLVALAIALFYPSKNEALKKKGIKAEGIVFDAESRRMGFDYELDATIKNVITVRFLTREKEWITGLLNQDFALFYRRQYRPGDKLDIYYDPEDPKTFYVDTGQSEFLVRIILAVAGLLFTGIGLFRYLN